MYINEFAYEGFTAWERCHMCVCVLLFLCVPHIHKKLSHTHTHAGDAFHPFYCVFKFYVPYVLRLPIGAVYIEVSVCLCECAYVCM